MGEAEMLVNATKRRLWTIVESWPYHTARMNEPEAGRETAAATEQMYFVGVRPRLARLLDWLLRTVIGGYFMTITE